MNLIIVVGTVVCCIFLMRECMFTVSKALLRSRETTMVRCGGCGWLKPWIIWFVIWCRAVVVEWRVLKPCWCFIWGRLGVMYGRRTFSKVLAIGESSDIGRYDVPTQGSLLGLGIGMILANFHIWGMMLWLRARFNKLVKYWMANGPRCFRCLMLILSGPVELLFDALVIAA